jgi:hypothetical protein
MNGTDMCFVCRRVDSRENLGAWSVGEELHAVHLECWLRAYDSRPQRSESRDVKSVDPREHGSEQTS